MIKCPWYSKSINAMSLVLPHHKNYNQVENSSLSQFGFNKSKTIQYNNTQCYYKTKHNHEVIKCYSYKISPSKYQQEILSRWFTLCNCVYNHCVIEFNKNSSTFSSSYMKQKLVVFKNLFGENKKPVPYDVLTDVVKQFCTNIKSCFTNLKKKHIKHFKMKLIIKPISHSILIPKKSINSSGFFPSIFGEINGFEKIETDEIECDSRLIYKNGEFYLKCPMKVKTKTQDKNNIVALDPGERNFLAFYSPNESGLIGTNLRETILKIQTKISIIDRAIARRRNRNGTKLKNLQKLKKRKRNYHTKIKNIVKELHNQTSLYLVKNYSKILIPKFETQDMIKCYGKRYIKKLHEDLNDQPEKLFSEMKKINKIRRLSKKQKFVLNSLSHFSFRQHLTHKCKEYNCELQVVTEEYTSKCCGACGMLSDNYTKRIKSCPYCGYSCDRDINGSRNILLKNSVKNIRPCVV